MGWEEVSKKGTYSMDGCLPKVEHNGQIEGGAWEWLWNRNALCVTSETKTTFVWLLTVSYPSILEMLMGINQEYSVKDFFGTAAAVYERNHGFAKRKLQMQTRLSIGRVVISIADAVCSCRSDFHPS